ncbi:MAG: hypothetical protein JXX28_18445 [Deltaproteobacteria bacterium]|nr:hypothetical protein [Deltaproteobacteria bacterium]
MRWTRTVLVALVVGWTLACAGVVEGDLTLDGAPFSATSCASGAPQGFVGVDLLDDSGRKLRLETGADGQAFVRLFESGLSAAEELGTCGPMSLTEQNSEINGVKNVMGDAELSCSGAHTLAGHVHYENCH